MSSQLQSIHFTLIDPDAAATEDFCKRRDQISIDSIFERIKVNISIGNIDIKHYFKKAENQRFDLIYFEHPSLSILNILMSKLGIARSPLEVSLQESIPHLIKVAKNGTVVIATFIFKGEQKHAISLLRLSLGIKMRRVRQRKMFTDGGFYSYGLIGVIGENTLPKKSPEQLTRKIQFNSLCLVVFVLLSLIIFLLSPNYIKILSFFCFTLQLFYYSYGTNAILFRLLVIVGQLMMVI